MVDFNTFVFICCGHYVHHFYRTHHRKGLDREYHFDVFYRFGVIDLLRELYDPSLGHDSAYEDWIPVFKKIDAHLKAQPGYDCGKIYDFVWCGSETDEKLREHVATVQSNRHIHEMIAMLAHQGCKSRHWNYWWSEARFRRSTIYKEMCRRESMLYRLSGDELAEIVYQVYRKGCYTLTPTQSKYVEGLLRNAYYTFE